MKNDKISVIIPVYNTNIDDLDTCLNSILHQTICNYEIIIVDDGSSDKIALFCDQIASLSEKIKVFHNDNHGVSWSRNFGIKKSTGQYICFIDADDIIENNMLEKLYFNIKNNDADISMCGYNYIELDGNKYPKYGTNKTIIFDRRQSLISMFDDQSFGVAVWNKMFKKDLIKKINFNENLHINEDRLFLFNAICESKKNVYEDVCLYNYIKRENSATTSQFNKKRFEVFKVNKIINKTIQEIYKNDNEIKNKCYKNENIYLIRLYRDLMLSDSKKIYKKEDQYIKNRLKQIINLTIPELNLFDKIETLLIVKFNFVYPLFIVVVKRFTILKKIKNIIQRSGN